MRNAVLIFSLFVFQALGSSFSRKVKNEIAPIIEAKVTTEEKVIFMDSLIKSDFFYSYDSSFYNNLHALSKTNYEKETVVLKLIDKEFKSSTECFKSLMKAKTLFYSTAYFTDLYKDKRLDPSNKLTSAANILGKYQEMNNDFDSKIEQSCKMESDRYQEDIKVVRNLILEKKYSSWLFILDIFHVHYYSKNVNESDSSISMIDRIEKLEKELLKDNYRSQNITERINNFKSIYFKKEDSQGM